MFSKRLTFRICPDTSTAPLRKNEMLERKLANLIDKLLWLGFKYLVIFSCWKANFHQKI